MVAACSANRGSHASVTSTASELGSLLLDYRSINEPRWRLRAVVSLAPVCRRFGIPFDRYREELRRGARAATCPASWHVHLVPLLEERVAHGEVRGLLLLVDALFTREWRACGIAAIAAMLALGEVAEAERVTALASSRRYAADVALPVMRTGCLGGAFVGNVSSAGSEREYRPSLPLVRACVAAIVARQQHGRVREVERLASKLPRRERAIADAQLARLTLCFETPAAALDRVRAIRERSVRAGGLLLLTRSTDDLGAMRLFTSAIETTLVRQAATLEIARALYRRGLHRHALRVLQYIDDPRLAAERILLGAEVRLTTRRADDLGPFVGDRLLHDAYRGPAWTYVDPMIDVGMLAHLLQTMGMVRFGMRHPDDVILFLAAEILRRHAFCRRARRYVLELAPRAGVETESALLALQEGRNSAALDAMRAESIAMRAERLVEVPPPESIANSDARSSERAHYDEALALSSAAPARRRVLITVAQACLRAALANPDEWSTDVVAARLRTLGHLGGRLAVDAICKALVTLPMHPSLTPLALDTLCKLDALAARSFVLARAHELHAANIDLARLMQLLEQHAAVPRGVWRAFAAARRALAEQQIAPLPWIAELLALLHGRVDALLRVLDGVSTYTTIPASPRTLLAEIEDVPRGLVARDHSTIARELAADTSLLEALLLARPANVDPKMRAWSMDEWRGLLRQATDYATVHVPQVARFVRKVDRRHWYDALRGADLAQLGVASTTTFHVRGTEYRLRLLDKRLDILTYLRFADVPARSCFRSDSDYRLAGDTIEAWKDPLTFCCHVERGEHRHPCGFLFGSFAAVGDQPALVMNSLHVRPNDGELRIQVLHAFERAICEPLAITRIGIANDHGGRGQLPASYAARSITIVRFRALARNGCALVQTYDDISDRLNEPVQVEALYWREPFIDDE